MSEYKQIPLLKASDVELRTATQRNDNITLLVYKDARVDMRILDECFGMMNWKRQHDEVNGKNYCTVSIRDMATGEWVSKQDVGTPSKTEAEKGEASDAFKRACFNWGIGRELYDAPDIKFKLDNSDFWTSNDGKKFMTTKFKVASMVYNEELHKFDEFVVVDNKGRERFSIKEKSEPTYTQEVQKAGAGAREIAEIQVLARRKGADLSKALRYFKVNAIAELSSDQLNGLKAQLEAREDV